MKKKTKDKMYWWFLLSAIIVSLLVGGVLSIDIIHKEKTIKNQQNEIKVLKLIINTK